MPSITRHDSSGSNDVTRLCGCDRKKAPGAKSASASSSVTFSLFSLSLSPSLHYSRRKSTRSIAD